MLISTSKVDESIVISDNITITILETGGSVRIGIEAPRDIEVHPAILKFTAKRSISVLWLKQQVEGQSMKPLWHH